MDMTVDMAGPTTSSVMPSATGQAMDHDMGGMGGMGNNCKISVSKSLMADSGTTPC